jgi:N-acetylglutamate synthase-like GNAT family acetyltransferase
MEISESDVKVRRAKPSDAAVIKTLVWDATRGRIKVERPDILEKLGAKGVLLAHTERLIGLIGFRVENLVCRIEDFLVYPVATRPIVGKVLFEAVEAEANRLQCEIALMFIHMKASQDLVDVCESLGYSVPEMGNWPPAWKGSLKEFGGSDRFVLWKQLRTDRVLKPI